MEALAVNQTQLGKEIEKLANEYRSESPDKKSLQYLQAKLQALEDLWTNFEASDDQIRDLYNESTVGHPYFANDYYQIVKKGYDDFKTELTTVINHASSSTSKGAITKSVQGEKRTLKLNTHENLPKSRANSNTDCTDIGNGDVIIRLLRRQKSVMTTLTNIIAGIKINKDQTKQYYDLKRSTITNYWEQIEDNNKCIWENTDDITSCGYNTSEYFQLQEKVHEILIKINEDIEDSINTNSTVSTNQSGLKLPKVTLPKFDGDYLKWQQFFDLFSQLVHNQPIGNSQKMWYLKMNLSGEAEKLIRHLPLTEDSYEIAWDMLQNRYQNKRLLVTALLEKLMAQPQITIESASALKNLHDTTKECLLTLQNMGLSVKEHWDPIIIHILVKKLDKNTHALFEQSLSSPRDLQSVEKLLSFLEKRFQALETLGQKSLNSKYPQKSSKPSVFITNQTNKTNQIVCVVCKKNHPIYFCEKFLTMQAFERQEKAKELNLCLNCLKSGHNLSQCRSRGCQKCNKRHNTLLHYQKNQHAGTQIMKPSSSQATTATNLAAQTRDAYAGYVFLGTALANVIDKDGKSIQCRLLLDSGSQLNFISDKFRKKLRLSDDKVNLNISGIGDSRVKINNRLNITLKSKVSDYATQLEVFVIKEISTHQPQQHINIDSWDIPSNMSLADPQFNLPQKIDILLGAEMYGEIMRNGQLRINENLPTLQNTTLGWIVLGKVSSVDYLTPFCGITNADLETQLQRFWELEHCPNKPMMSSSDKKCEEYFESTVSRSAEGRFIVNLPILTDPKLLGESKQLAFKRLISIERKLAQEPQLRKQYNEFLDEYIRLGHMQELDPQRLTRPYYFLPHHCVLKPTSSTTKLRVVFDGSAKTTNSLSLNDLLLNGPKIQDDISTIIMRFRVKRYVFTADIAKMYRQILVAEEDRNLQLIMWRKQPTDTVKYYQLCTVTYGTKSAPYLAVKCIQKLAEEEAGNYPLGAAAVKNFYVDDVLTGSDDLDEAIDTQRQLKQLLSSGGFQLRKWCANHPKLVQNIPREDLEIKLNFSEMEGEHIKTLGLVWHPIMDWFTITTCLKNYKTFTKRTILADMSQIFDPLGLVNPVVVMGKMFIQKLWKLKLDWDDEIPSELQSSWLQFRTELQKLNDIKIPRYMFSNEPTINIELHAFSDASERAYGTALYIRSKEKSGKMTVKLLCAKSKVAPVKPITIPRLELCAAKLAAQLVHHVKSIMNIKFDEIHFWTDSQIVLAWIKGDPSLLKTFVANRVVAIQELTEGTSWRYVNTKDNPADIVSRGLTPGQLVNARLWFEGPAFLKTSKKQWPQRTATTIRLQEEEKTVKLTVTALDQGKQHPVYVIDHGNSFRKLQRVMAYILRSVEMFKQRRRRRQLTSFLTVRELEDALIVICKEMQSCSFQEELRSLHKHNEVHRNSKLKNAAPFIDTQGVIRVGGRLDNADIEYDTKHPIVLPADHFITKLLMNHLHTLHLHAGPQALQAIARQRFWILQCRNLARSVVNNCVRCTRIRPKLFHQQMGNLPKDRVQKARPFINCGVDFCGPVYTHYKIRGKRPQKTYIAVFCCFATKAIHLEVVSDLSTEGFLGALRRFTARRGRCEHIYCDNGRNFVGASNKLREISDILSTNNSRTKIVNKCLDQKIQFHFIPPRSPHFGGLWEAAVKSTKHFLQRTVASASLTYEELCTATSEIEAILNSRPLTPLSSDPNDLLALTPAHFIIGEPMTTTVDSVIEQQKMSLLARWELVSHIRNEFWRRWSMEYLTDLQKRTKWMDQQPNIQPGTLVIMKDENLPPLKWSLGRIVEIIQGADGRIRVADVRTATGIFRRAIHQLAPLPVELNDSTDTSNQLELIEVDEGQNSYSNEEEEVPRNTRKRKQSQKPINALKVILLTMLLLPLSVKAVWSETQVEQLESVSILDLKGYWASINIIQDALKHLERLSRTITHNDYYIEIVSQYYHQLEELNNSNVLLKDQSNNSTKPRAKRSPLDVVGTIANKLFGVLDNEYASRMTETINRIKNNEDHLHELIKNQTSVLETTVNVIKKSEEDRCKQTKRIEEALELAYEKMRNMSSEQKQQRSIQTFNTLSVLVASLVNECKFMQEAILDVVTDTHHGRSSPLVISPEQLRMQLSVIKDNLPSGIQLPTFSGQISVSLVYKLMKIQCQLQNDYIIFELIVPLVRSTTFELYRLISLPTLVNDTFVSVAPATDFLMTNLFRDQFYLMNNFELMQCFDIGKNYHLCEQRRPLHIKTPTSNICEVELFARRTLPRTCALRITKPTNLWIKLAASNQWIFCLDKKYNPTFICGNDIIHKTLDGTGILSMQHGCAMKDDELLIETSNDLQTRTDKKSVQPNFNITPDDLDKFEEDSTPVFYRSRLTTHGEEFDNLIKEIKNIKVHQTKLQDLQPHDVHQFTIGYVTVGIISVIIIYLSLTHCKNSRTMRLKSKPIPLPRSNPAAQDYSFEVGDFKGAQDVQA